MTEVKTTIKLPAPAAEVWKAIGRFDALPSWHPLVNSAESEQGGTVRRLTTPAGEFVEELEGTDDAARTYRYETTSSPLSIGGAHSTLRVREEGDGAVVEWESEFQTSAAGDVASDPAAAMRDMFQAGLDNLAKLFGGKG
jgi:uncharacterized protein YndB with AHSA1/START domain